FFAPRTGEENVDRRINALIADLAVEHHLHVTSAFELLENQFVHAATGFDQGAGHDGERAGFLSIARGREDFSRNFHGASIDTAAHGAPATRHRVIKGARGTGNRVEQDENVLAGFDETLGTFDRELGDTRV